MRVIVLTLPYIPPRGAFPRAFEGRHFSARSGAKAMMKQDVVVQCGSLFAKVLESGPFKKAHITITFRSPRGNYDLDNALSASKGWIDGLVAAGVLVNDTAVRVSYTVRWERQKEEATELRIEERNHGR